MLPRTLHGYTGDVLRMLASIVSRRTEATSNNIPATVLINILPIEITVSRTLFVLYGLVATID